MRRRSTSAATTVLLMTLAAASSDDDGRAPVLQVLDNGEDALEALPVAS